jgi:hypothetical protein
MADDMDERDRPLERVKRELAGLDKTIALVERTLIGKLGHEDAQRIMDFARAGDDRILVAVGDRINEFRSEVREGFKHAATESSAALYRANTEMEARIMGAIAALAAQSQPESKRSGWHPVGYGIGGASIGSGVLYLILALLGIVPHPG